MPVTSARRGGKDAPMSKRLLIVNPDQCMEVHFDQQITIGRDLYNSLSLQDAEVSRSHAIIFEQDGNYIVKDLKSHNGVFVRGQRTTEQILEPGDEVIMGATVLIFDPSDTLDLGLALSKRGHYLLEKRAGQAGGVTPQPVTVYSCKEMNEAIDSLFNDPEATSFFTMENAVLLLQTIREMDDARDPAAMFDVGLRRALGMLGGHRGAIMETDRSKEHVKVRAFVSTEDTDSILIAKPILRVVVGAQKCVYCPNVLRDKRFVKIAAKSDRPIHSFVTAPVISQDELFGFIYLDSQDASVTYDYTALRSLYFIASHVGSLLRPRPTHFNKQIRSAEYMHTPS